MGKIEISEDLRNKLDKVLSYKSADIGDIPVGPAPSWKSHLQPPQPPQPLQPSQPPQPLQPSQVLQVPQAPQDHQVPRFLKTPQSIQMPLQQPKYYVKYDKNKKKKDKIKYYKITKIVFLSSVVAGIGMTLGLKIANILFF